MEKKKIEHCRLCAEPKNPQKLLNLQLDRLKHEEILLKLAFVNAFYVDISDNDPLPKTVCLVCYTSLNKAYEFLKGVKFAQETLSNIFSLNDSDKNEVSDDDHMPTYGGIHTSKTNVAVKLEELTSEESCDGAIVSLKVKRESQVEIELLGRTSDRQAKVSTDDEELTDSSEKSIKCWDQYTWTCSGCDKEFISLDELRSHAKDVHSKCAAFLCLDCGEDRKKNFSSFVKHVTIHRRALRKCCYYCNTQLERPEDIHTHLKQHFQNSQVPCELCAEILNGEEALNDHLQNYRPDEPKPKPEPKPRRKRGIPYSKEDLTCKICNNVYKNPNSLRDHIKRHEDRKRSYVCDRCGKSFFSKGTLRMHIITHDNYRPHICHICNKAFRFVKKLKDHILTHSEDKPFACEQCGKCFRLKYQLNCHKIIHTDLMPFVCQYCNKAFRFKQILKNHELQHTGVKPYSCENCGMVFTNWSNYNKHMKRKHNIDTSKKKRSIVEMGQSMQMEDSEDRKSKGRKGKTKSKKVDRCETDPAYKCPVPTQSI